MDDYEIETKRDLDLIPEQLRKTYAPKIRDQFAKIYTIMSSIEKGTESTDDIEVIRERDDCVVGMDSLSEEFVRAGGTEGQWNSLAASVANGSYFDIYKP